MGDHAVSIAKQAMRIRGSADLHYRSSSISDLVVEQVRLGISRLWMSTSGRREVCARDDGSTRNIAYFQADYDHVDGFIRVQPAVACSSPRTAWSTSATA
jgi:hypothetical protein